MPRGVLAAPKPTPTSPTCCCKHSHTVLQDLAQEGFKLDSFDYISYFRSRPLQLWPMVTRGCIKKLS